MTPVIETSGLTKRHRRVTALSDCTINVPEGRISALVGPKQLCGDIDTLLDEHRILTGPRKDTTAIARTHAIVREDTTARQTTLLVRLNGPVIDPAWAVEEANLEEIVLGYMSQDDPDCSTGPEATSLSAVGGDR
jgi:hypothetical protein